ncbi:DUF6415 family natural product biosynthesis protein [Streptomyces sp. NPDC056160]|uniref:DUF6415 family natural product biosynthesis protein n=1 Tax=Streptomyces sp. NPDC056160 TaxID=3345731 RepID=UPI0035DEE9C4
MDAAGLALVLAKLLRWTGADVEALLDDVAEVLDDVLPPVAELEGPLRRIRAQLGQLVATAAEPRPGAAASDRLLACARAACSETVPTDRREVLGYARRLGWATNELMEHLVLIGRLDAP